MLVSVSFESKSGEFALYFEAAEGGWANKMTRLVTNEAISFEVQGLKTEPSRKRGVLLIVSKEVLSGGVGNKKRRRQTRSLQGHGGARIHKN